MDKQELRNKIFDSLKEPQTIPLDHEIVSSDDFAEIFSKSIIPPEKPEMTEYEFQKAVFEAKEMEREKKLNENKFRIEENSTTGWEVLDECTNLSKERAIELINTYILQGYNPNHLRIRVDQ